MAYMSQDRKQQLAPAIKAVLKKYNMKGTLSVRHHSTLVLTISKGPIDFFAAMTERVRSNYDESRGHVQVNEYYIRDHYTGVAADFLSEVKDAMMNGNHNNSDPMTDYHDVGWYIDINVGKWDKPYILV